jgi:MFS family permease
MSATNHERMTQTNEPRPPRTAHDPYAALRVRNYRLFLAGWVFALLGTRIQSVAIAWEMYQRTGDALALGLVGLAQALPTMLLALPAGYLADRFNRPRLVMLSLAGMTLTSLALALLSYLQGSVTLMYLFLFLDAAAVILGRPARSALMTQLVPRHVFPNAVTWNTSFMQISGVVGPALGGFIILWSVPGAYVIAALSSLIYLAMLSRLELRHDPELVAGASPWENLVAGIRFVGQTRVILAMITLDMFGVLLGGAVYLLPIYAEEILKVGASGFGWLRAAPALGALCMAVLLIYLPPMKRAGWSLLLNVAGFGVATIIFGLSTSFWPSFAMLFLSGAFDNVSMVIRQTLQQLLTPNHMRGRVSAVSAVFISASNELGGMESGMVAHWFGPVFSVVSGGIGTLVVVALAGWLSPELRAQGPLHETKPVSGPETSPAKSASLRTRHPAPSATPSDD